MTYDLSMGWTIVLIAGLVWELMWKGMAMWRAAQHGQPVWFALLLVIGSVGVVPIFYLITHHAYSHNVVTGRSAI